MTKFVKKLMGLVIGLSLVAGVGIGAATLGSKDVKVDAGSSIHSTLIFGSGTATSTYTSDFSETISGITWKMSNFNANNWGWSGSSTGANKLIKCGRKSNASVGIIQNTTSLAGAKINKVDLFVPALTSDKINSITLYSGDSTGLTTNTLATLTTGFAKGTITLNVASPSAYNYYTIKVDCASGTSNGLFSLDKVIFYIESLSEKYTVTYDANGATSGSVPTDSTEYDKDASVTVLGNTGSLSKTDFNFSCWNTKSDGSGTDYSAGNTFTITEDVTLFAKWVVNHTYNGDGTQANPFDAEDAYYKVVELGGGESANSYYITGTVASVETFNPTYGNFTFVISKNGKNFTGFRLLDGRDDESNPVKFTAATDLELGDTVLIHSTIQDYNGTKETKTGSIVGITKAVMELSSIAITGSMTKTAYSVGAEWDATGFVVTATFTTGSQLVVTSDVVWTFNPTSPELGVTSVTATASYTYDSVTKNATSNAQSVTVRQCIEINTETFSEISTSYTTTYTHLYSVDASKVSMEAYGVYKNGGIQVNKDKGTYIKNTTAIPGYITSIIIEWKASGKNSINMYANSCGVASTDSTLIGEGSSTDKTQTFTITDPATANYNFFYFDGTPLTGACVILNMTINYTAITAEQELSNWSKGYYASLKSGETPICKGQGSTDTAALKTAWDEQALMFADLSSDARALAKTGTALETGTDTEKALYLYDYCTSHYADTICSRFITNRAVSSLVGQNRFINLNSDYSIGIILVIAFISVSSITAFILVKKYKRRHE